MFCKNCGSEVREGAQFCTNCGAPVEQVKAEPAQTYQEPVYQSPVYEQPQQPTYQTTVVPSPAVPSSSVLTWGILGLAFACSFYISFLGIIFSIIAQNKAKAYQAAGGQLTGKAKVGSILAKVGLIVGIVLTAILAIYLLVLIIAAIVAALD